MYSSGLDEASAMASGAGLKAEFERYPSIWKIRRCWTVSQRDLTQLGNGYLHHWRNGDTNFLGTVRSG
jgi:hypothetical protein